MTSLCFVYLFTGSNHKCHIKSSKISIEKMKNGCFSFFLLSRFSLVFLMTIILGNKAADYMIRTLNDYCYFNYNYHNRCYVSMGICEIVFFFSFIFERRNYFKTCLSIFYLECQDYLVNAFGKNLNRVILTFFEYSFSLFPSSC